MLTIEQINAQKQALADQLKQLEELQKNFSKRDEGFKKLETLEAEFAKKQEALDAEKLKKRSEILKAHYITEEELAEIEKQKNAPKALIVINYKDGEAQKSWDWFVGRKGKVPQAVQDIRSKGILEVSKYFTEEGKKAMETADGKQAIEKWIAQSQAKQD